MMPRPESDNEWKETLEKTKGTKWQRGTGTTMQILVKKGDYALYKQSLAQTQSWTTGEKQKKNPSEADFKKGIEKIKQGQASFTDDTFD
eukprot:8537739-Pyramimonas_sp.AAC.1